MIWEAGDWRCSVVFVPVARQRFIGQVSLVWDDETGRLMLIIGVIVDRCFYWGWG